MNGVTSELLGDGRRGGDEVQLSKGFEGQAGPQSMVTSQEPLHEQEGISALQLAVRVLQVLVLFGVWFLLELLIKAATVVQLVHVAWKRRPHPAMQRLGAMVGDYTDRLWRYCSFASREAPWPFGPWSRRPAEPRS